ncbi:unnamed protein product, partial [Mesorhabditis belari]|uniref:Beta-galactosidase n=1 Tax=Mesorhabditis belari TaxID=2138241 RepID=A0AAF3FRY7_9BILA
MIDFLLLSLLVSSSLAQTTSFKVDPIGKQFLLDGKPFRYISGEIHYFRIHPDQWEDRLKRVRALGFNAIQYYVPWNFHQPDNEQTAIFDGIRNFTRFSEIAINLGMYSILRVGPYICAEWENGGLPWWLLNKSNDIVLRSSDPRYLNSVALWFTKLLPIIQPMMRQNGGPVLMVQVENEYGSYFTCDTIYMQWLRDSLLRGLGSDTQLFTTDPPENIKCGVVDGVYPTVDFGPSKDLENAFKVQLNYTQGKGPLVNSEFYPGWFSVWGDKKKPNLPTTQETLDYVIGMYEKNASFSVYMIHGGTNFAFWNGAEYAGPLITSYDYFAPISESGDIMPIALAIRSYLKTQKDWPNQPQNIPANNARKSYGSISLQKVSQLNEFPSNCPQSDSPQSFEKLGHGFGFVAYTATLPQCNGGKLNAQRVSDRGDVFVDGKYIDTLQFSHSTIQIPTTNCKSGAKLTILVENTGRINFETGNYPKGLLSDVNIDGTTINGWMNCPIQMSEQIQASGTNETPVPNDPSLQGVYSGTFQVDTPIDTWIDASKWGKGILFINGLNMGRYWTKGPQLTLYVPAPVLKVGTNTLTIVELDSNYVCSSNCKIDSVDAPKWTW